MPFGIHPDNWESCTPEDRASMEAAHIRELSETEKWRQEMQREYERQMAEAKKR